MKNILITGGSGFIGKSLIEKLGDDYELMAPDRDELDLCDTVAVEEYLKSHDIDIIIHAANHGLMDANIVSMSDIFTNGLRMFFNLARCQDMYERMYYFGSGAEYDRENYIPFMKEEYFGEHVPRDEYGFYKYIISNYCTLESNIYDLRLFGVYGKYEEWRLRFISSNICRILKGLPMTLSQNKFFDYIYVDDLAEIMKWFVENRPLHHHYNVCRGEHIDLKSLGEIIRNTLNSDCEFKIAKEGLGIEYSGNNDRLRQEIADYHFKSYEETIAEMYEYYKTTIDEVDEKLLP